MFILINVLVHWAVIAEYHRMGSLQDKNLYLITSQRLHLQYHLIGD
jgi:hypothetical protein